MVNYSSLGQWAAKNVSEAGREKPLQLSDGRKSDPYQVLPNPNQKMS